MPAIVYVVVAEKKALHAPGMDTHWVSGVLVSALVVTLSVCLEVGWLVCTF